MKLILKNFKKIINKKFKDSNKSQILSSYLEQFFSSPHHEWINQDSYLKRVLIIFFESLDKETLKTIWRRKEVILLQTNGKLSCTLSSFHRSHFIIIFPELYKLLTSCSPHHGLAILAHELGHIIQEHSSKKISSLESQIEADRFAFELGYGKELINILSEYDKLPECKIRIEKLQERLKNAYSSLRSLPFKSGAENRSAV